MGVGIRRDKQPAVFLIFPDRGAEQLGLQGSVDKDVFTRLLEGRLPDGADLSRMQDGSNRHRPGYDLTFSAPKSVSMMAMLGARENLLQERLQQMERDMVRDLQKEKTLGGD
ncbi:relaxase domain-containing protein [Escherichia coli]